MLIYTHWHHRSLIRGVVGTIYKHSIDCKYVASPTGILDISHFEIVLYLRSPFCNQSLSSIIFYANICPLEINEC